MNLMINVNFEIIKENFRDENGKKINWKFNFVEQPQIQAAGSNDCGVMVIYYALRFLLNREQKITIDHVSEDINKYSIINNFLKDLTGVLRNALKGFMRFPNNRKQIIKHFKGKFVFIPLYNY